MSETFKHYANVIINDVIARLVALLFVFVNLVICSVLVLYLTLPEPVLLQWFNISDFNKPDMYILVSWICIAFTTLTLSLWVFHAVGILKFTDNWTSKAIYGVAISAILGTTVSIYSNAIVGQNVKPLEGKWNMEYTFMSSYINKDEWEVKAGEGHSRNYASALVSWNPEQESYEVVSYGGKVQLYIPNLELNTPTVEVLAYFPIMFKTSERKTSRTSSTDDAINFNKLSSSIHSTKYIFEVSGAIDTQSKNINLQRKNICWPNNEKNTIYQFRDDLICELKLSRAPFK